MRRVFMVLLALVWLAAMIVAGICLVAPPPPAVADAHYVCPATMTCITGKLVIRDPGSDTPHQFLVEDKNGAPMLWVDYGGLGLGGEPACLFRYYPKPPHLRPEACLGGPWGNYGGRAVVTLYAHGRAYSLTARDITWIHAHGG